jgi:hypothetical protein
VSFAAKTLCVASQRVFIVVSYFFTDSVQKFLDTPSSLSQLRVKEELDLIELTWGRVLLEELISHLIKKVTRKRCPCA